MLISTLNLPARQKWFFILGYFVALHLIHPFRMNVYHDCLFLTAAAAFSLNRAHSSSWLRMSWRE